MVLDVLDKEKMDAPITMAAVVDVGNTHSEHM